MAEPNDADQPPPAPAPASSSPTDAGAGPDQDPTQLLTKLFAGTTLAVPTDDAPNRIDQTTPPAAADAPVVSTAAGHDPGVTSSAGDPISPILKSMMSKSKAPLATPPPPPPAFPMAGNYPGPAASDRGAIIELLAKLVGDGEPTTPRRPVAPPLRRGGGGSGTERAARRRVFKVPTDYLRAGQESRERRRRRAVVRRNVRVLLSIHEDRASERVLSAMMARLATTTMEPAAGDGGVSAASKDAAAAASSTEHDELGEMMDKMELSFKD